MMRERAREERRTGTSSVFIENGTEVRVSQIAEERVYHTMLGLLFT
jgi:hypothetical protein